MQLNQAIQKLGILSLKPKQEKVIKKILKGKNVISVLPTGYGKSACYIVSHLVIGKSTIVISPLISLMEDQARKLTKYNILSICFNSINEKNQEFFEKVRQIKEGEKTGILLFSPESFLKNDSLIRHLIINKRLGLITLDESHCLSNWKGFRSSYTELGVIQQWIKNKNIPFLAMTATSTDEMIRELMKSLGIDKASLVRESFYKSNLNLHFCHKSRVDSDVLKMKYYIQDRGNAKTIVYCKTRKETETISNRLNRSGIRSQHYHANLLSTKRQDIQNQFTNGDLNIIVSTIAFGMGIDIPNIYLIIHYGISQNIESYYQEIGRGGRDGSETLCVLMWGPKDFFLNDRFNQTGNPAEASKLQNKSNAIKDFVYTHECRQKFICQYFGETIESCGKCDNCERFNKQSDLPIMSTYLILKRLKQDMMRPSIHQLYQNWCHQSDITLSDFKDLLRVLETRKMLRKIRIRTSKGNSQEVIALSPDGIEWGKNNTLKIQKALNTIKHWLSSKKGNIEMARLFNFVNRCN